MSEERIGQEPDDGDDLSILDDLLGVEPDDPETETEEQPALEPEGEAEPPPQPTRGQRRIRALNDRLKERDEENRRLRQQMDQMLTQTRQPAAPAFDPYRAAELQRQEAERVAQMMPHEQAAYYSSQAEQRMQQQLLRAQIENRDLLDQQLFSQLKSRDRLAERYSDQVESLLAAARQQGMNPSREVILNALVGQEVRQKASRQIDATRRRAARQVAAQTTQPGGGRAGAPAARRQAGQESDEEFEARLKGVTLGEVW